MKKRNLFEKTKGLMWTLMMLVVFSVSSCQNEGVEEVAQSNDVSKFVVRADSKITVGDVTSEIIQEYTVFDLLLMQQRLEAAGITLSGLILPQAESSTRGIINNALLSAIKITTKSPHPSDPTRQIDQSGVLLVPKLALTSLRLVVVPPGTYLDDNQAASNLFANEISLINNDGAFNSMAFWALQAYQGCAVLLLDYPGYGDSRQQCFHPYMVQDILVNATIDMAKAAQTVMTSRGYRYKSQLIATGYSQGAFVATSFARELELNPSHGLDVNLLFAGGTPANFTEMTNSMLDVVEHDFLWIIGYLACGYQSSKYPEIVFSDIFNEPYASELYYYYDGTYPTENSNFPTVVADLLTQDVLENLETSPKFEVIRRAMVENSIQPWVNECKMVMGHALQDDIVTYSNAKNFADQQNAIGGDVTFHTYPLGKHVANYISYYIDFAAYILLYK